MEFLAQYPAAAALVEEAEGDVLAYMAFPEKHWRRIRSTTPPERRNREIRRWTDGPQFAGGSVGVTAGGQMDNRFDIPHTLDRALAFAHAALEQTTPRFVVEALRETRAALARIGDALPAAMPLGEAHQVVERLGHLRAVMGLLERRVRADGSCQ